MVKSPFSHFIRDFRGNIAMTFALLLMPIMLAFGSAIDYARMGQTHTNLQNAADTAALVVAQEVEKGKSATQVNTTLNATLANSLPAQGIDSWTASYTANSGSSTVKVTISASIKSTFLAILGWNTLPVGTTSEATYGKDAVEIALALDNTGSMANYGKLSYMKTAAKGMITSLQGSSAAALGKVSVSIVPFTVAVNVGSSYDTAPWMDAQQTTSTCSSWYWSWWGWQCSSYYSTPRSWAGCVGDRTPTYNTANTLPTASISATLYPHDYYPECPAATIFPLSTDLAAAKVMVDTMQASGNTNVPIGAAWGWNMLTPGAPLSNSVASTATNKVNKYLVLLTDGENTQNTLGSSYNTMNTYTSTVCSSIKNAGVTVFVIKVIDGNTSLLQNCASSASYFYDVSDPATLSTVFDSILLTIQKLRLSS